MRLVTDSKLIVTGFPGTWHCRYWYPSNNHAGEDVSEYTVLIDQKDGAFVLHSLPNAIEAYMLARFTVEANMATGTWLENTSPHGEFAAMVYSGVFQLLINDDCTKLAGRWVGIGREKDGPRIYEGQ